jgi:two-component system OmpR family response regulator
VHLLTRRIHSAAGGATAELGDIELLGPRRITPLPEGAPPRRRILCVDDNPDIADAEAMLLALVGFDARPCYGGRDALALAEVFRPSVCLLDMNMPGMDGDELAARLHQRANGRPLLMIAVTAMSADACRGRAGLFDLHLFKPVETEQLLAAVASTVCCYGPRAGRT